MPEPSSSVYTRLLLCDMTLGGEGGGVQCCDTPVRVDAERRIVFARDPQHDLPRAERGGRALATLFDGDRRRVAQAWRTAWDLAESGRTATLLELAQQRVKRQQEAIGADINRELNALQVGSGRKRRSAGGGPRRPPARSGEQMSGGPTATEEASAAKPRVLVDPESLTVIGPKGRVVESSAGGGPPRCSGSSLVEPSERSRTPRNKVALRSYSDLDRENVGFDLARMVLSSDREDIVNLWAQCGVGADAMDKLKRFY